MERRWLVKVLPFLLVICGQQFQFQGDVVRFAAANNFVIRDECKRPAGEAPKTLTVPITIKISGPAREPDKKKEGE